MVKCKHFCSLVSIVLSSNRCSTTFRSTNKVILLLESNNKRTSRVPMNSEMNDGAFDWQALPGRSIDRTAHSQRGAASGNNMRDDDDYGDC